MRKYKLVLLLKSGLSKDKKDKVLSNVKKWIGEVKNDSVDSLGEKKLAYMIKREKSAEYVVMNFEADNLATDLDKRLAIDEDVLRHLVIREK